MKIMILAMSLIFSFASHASIVPERPIFSALSNGDDLFVTIIGDSCNKFHANLLVDESCKSDRLTRNLAPACSAQLMFSATRMACNDKRPIARVITMSLKANKVSPETFILNLVYQKQTVKVILNQ